MPNHETFRGGDQLEQFEFYAKSEPSPERKYERRFIELMDSFFEVLEHRFSGIKWKVQLSPRPRNLNRQVRVRHASESIHQNSQEKGIEDSGSLLIQRYERTRSVKELLLVTAEQQQALKRSKPVQTDTVFILITSHPDESTLHYVRAIVQRESTGEDTWYACTAVERQQVRDNSATSKAQNADLFHPKVGEVEYYFSGYYTVPSLPLERRARICRGDQAFLLRSLEKLKDTIFIKLGGSFVVEARIIPNE